MKMRRDAGFSLVELMVGIVISIICTMAMMSAFASFEAQKRTTTNASDAQQNGSFSAYELEREIRTAGAGLTQGKSWGLWGCKINYSDATGVVLPASTAFPAPFAAWPRTIQAVPVLALSGGKDASGNDATDVLSIVRGNPAVHTFKSVVVSASGQTATMDNALGFVAGEYALLTDQSGIKGCTLSPLSAVDTVTNVLTLTASAKPFAGNWDGTGYVFDMGNEPALSLYGVDVDAASPTYHSLMTYDLMKRSTTPLVPMADGILAIKILYGVDDGTPTGTVANDNIIDEWVPPTGIWSLATLTPATDTSAARTARSQIKAVRVAVVAISKLPERAPASSSSDGAYIGYTGGATLKLFTDLPAASQYTITTDTQYRYKVYDTVVPVRNALVTQFF